MPVSRARHGCLVSTSPPTLQARKQPGQLSSWSVLLLGMCQQPTALKVRNPSAPAGRPARLLVAAGWMAQWTFLSFWQLIRVQPGAPSASC